jgi:two-component system response regulator TctD
MAVAKPRRQHAAVKILLVEDDLDLSGALSRVLAPLGHQLVCCADGLEALAMARRQSFDAIVLDLGLPTLDGLQMLQRLRDGANSTPVLVVTARGSTEDKVMGLNLGADDYLAKPFDLDELQARLNALLRRSAGEEELTCGMLRLDRKSGIFYNDMRPLDLSPREGALLKALLRKRGQVVTKEALREAVFGADAEASSDAIEVLVHRLRKRISGACVEVMTLRGVGYLLIDEAIAGKDD